jgi:hypothetical protein
MAESPVEKFVSDTITVGLTDTASYQSRHYLAPAHLWMALHNARRAEELETELVGKAHFNIEHQTCVIATILGATAFLEALVNELFEDAVEWAISGSKSRLQPLTDQELSSAASYWKSGGEGDRVIDKYQEALKVTSQPKINMGQRPGQDLKLLVDTRNKLVHFKPRWHDPQVQDSMQRAVGSKFSPNALLAGTNNPWFPGKCLGAGCARWACDTARTIADTWTVQLGLPNTYADSLSRHEQP